MKRLRAEGVRVAATLVFNAAQAILAAKAGASMVCVHIDQLDAQGQDGVSTIAEIHEVFEMHGVECDVLAALPRQRGAVHRLCDSPVRTPLPSPVTCYAPCSCIR
jgi:transaldolase